MREVTAREDLCIAIQRKTGKFILPIPLIGITVSSCSDLISAPLLEKIIRVSHFWPKCESAEISLQALQVDRAACGDMRLPTLPCAHLRRLDRSASCRLLGVRAQ